MTPEPMSCDRPLLPSLSHQWLAGAPFPQFLLLPAAVETQPCCHMFWNSEEDKAEKVGRNRFLFLVVLFNQELSQSSSLRKTWYKSTVILHRPKWRMFGTICISQLFIRLELFEAKLDGLNKNSMLWSGPEWANITQVPLSSSCPSHTFV